MKYTIIVEKIYGVLYPFYRWRIIDEDKFTIMKCLKEYSHPEECIKMAKEFSECMRPGTFELVIT